MLYRRERVAAMKLKLETITLFARAHVGAALKFEGFVFSQNANIASQISVLRISLLLTNIHRD